MLTTGFRLFLSAFVVMFTINSAHAVPSFFHSNEKQINNKIAFVKWNDMVERYYGESESDCREDGFECPAYVFDLFIESTADAPTRHQLATVNSVINNYHYRPDQRVWGISDYWATPGEFFTRGGDCEDFAIAKFFALKRLGWSDDNLRIVAVKNQHGKGHAVLIVKDGDNIWMLDNMRRRVIDATEVDYYQPIYSINETSIWLHTSGSQI